MAVIFQTKTDPVWASNTGQTVTLPSGTAAGDLLILSVTYGASADRFQTPTDWTERLKLNDAGTGLSIAVYWKIATSGDVSTGSVTYALSLSSINAGGLTRITGHDPTTPIFASNAEAATGTTSHVFTGITPAADCLFMSFGVGDNDVAFTTCAMATSDPTFTLDSSITTTLGNDFVIGTWHSGVRSPATATGNITQVSATTLNSTIGAILAIQPIVSSKRLALMGVG